MVSLHSPVLDFAVPIGCAKLIAARCHIGPMGTHEYEVRRIAHCGCSLAYTVEEQRCTQAGARSALGGSLVLGSNDEVGVYELTTTPSPAGSESEHRCAFESTGTCRSASVRLTWSG
jgi:hypothetical protein